MDRDYFVLYGTKDKDEYYIGNTNPIIWASNLLDAKKYYNRYSAEYDILRDYDNYRFMTKQIDNNLLDDFYVALIHNNEEKWRVKIL